MPLVLTQRVLNRALLERQMLLRRQAVTAATADFADREIRFAAVA